MKILSTIRCALTVLIILGLAACGGSGGGGGGSSGGSSGSTSVPQGTFSKTVSLPGSSANWIELFYSVITGTRRFQALVHASDLKGSGPASSLALTVLNAHVVPNTCPNVTVRLGHSSLGSLGTTFATNVDRSSLIAVYGAATLTIPAGAAGQTLSIPLNGAFNYNGVDNLIVDITSDRCTGNTILAGHAPVPAYVPLVWNSLDSGAATGSAYNYLADMHFTFAGGDNALVYTDGGTTLNVSTAPFSPGITKVQLLYPASEVNGSGPITGIAMRVATSPRGLATVGSTHTVSIRLGHTSLNALTATFNSNFNVGSPGTVANAVSFSVPANVNDGEYVWLPLPDGFFNYNGTDNLLVEITDTAPSGTAYWIVDDLPGSARLLFAGSSAATTGSVAGYRYHAKFRFNGGSVDVNTPNGIRGQGFVNLPDDGRQQYLFLASELGSSATLSKLACRAKNNVSAAAGFNYSVNLSHTTASVLGSNFSANLQNPVTVFSGALSLPAMSVGDWAEIPFTTPFAYNGHDNLIVEISGTGPARVVYCALDEDSPLRYIKRTVVGYPSNMTRGSVVDALIDMRFTTQ